MWCNSFKKEDALNLGEKKHFDPEKVFKLAFTAVISVNTISSVTISSITISSDTSS